MIKRILLILLFILSTVSYGYCETGRAIITWNPNTESDFVGYRVYISFASGQYLYGSGSPNLVATIPCDPHDANCCTHTQVFVLFDTTYFFVVTGYDIEGYESEPSNEVSCTTGSNPVIGVPPAAPTGISLEFIAPPF